MSEALAVIGQQQGNGVAEYHRKATDVAGAVKALVIQQAISLGGRKYLPVAAYQAVANAMGCTTSARDVQKVDGGYTAIGEVRRLSDGMVIATGEGFVGDDEPKWAKGPEYARRAMVQTRAIGRACRAALAFVVPMIDSKLETTPHEEMAGIIEAERQPPPAPLGVEKLRQAATGTTPSGSPRKLELRDEPPPHGDEDAPPPEDAQVVEAPKAADASRPPPMTIRWGKSQGKSSHDLTDRDLKFYADAAAKSVADPDKARFKEQNASELELLQAEQRWRQAGGR